MFYVYFNFVVFGNGNFIRFGNIGDKIDGVCNNKIVCCWRYMCYLYNEWCKKELLIFVLFIFN